MRWVDPAGIHLTLAFLGELNQHDLEQAMAATNAVAACYRSFSYRLAGLGMFGPARNPRVLWAGISEPSGVLKQVQHALTLALEQRALPVDTRPFSPHLTLARIKTPLNPEQLQRLRQWLARPQTVSSDCHVTHLAVMKSELTPSGARYTCLEACALQR